MKHENETVQPAHMGQVDQGVRPVAWVRDLGPQPHCVTDSRYCTAGDVDRGVHLQYLPLYDQATVDAAVSQAQRERNNAAQVRDAALAALFEVDRLAGYDDAMTEWRNKWAHLWALREGPNVVLSR